MARLLIENLKTKAWFSHVQTKLKAATPSRVGWLLGGDEVIGSNDPERKCRAWASGKSTPSNKIKGLPTYKRINRAVASYERTTSTHEQERIEKELNQTFETGPKDSYLWETFSRHITPSDTLIYHAEKAGYSHEFYECDTDSPQILKEALDHLLKSNASSLIKLAAVISYSNANNCIGLVPDELIIDAAKKAADDLAIYNLTPSEIIETARVSRNQINTSNCNSELARGWATNIL